MPTILDLYKSATKNVVENEIYGKDASRIETKGIVNIPRQAALMATSPNAVADLIGGQAAGLLKGSANRPSDTIFKNSTPFSKPISITGGVALKDGDLKDVIEEGKSYFVKTSPSPASLFAKIKQGASTPLGLASATAASALSNPLATVNTIKDLNKSIKNANNDADVYGSKFMKDRDGKTLKATKKFSQFVPNYTATKNKYSYDKSATEYVRKNIDYPELPASTGNPSADLLNVAIKYVQKSTRRKNWDLINNDILKYETINDKAKQNFESNHSNNKITYVTITTYGDRTNKIILPGTITGLTEDYSPEWSNFKYVGSPFYSYRYGGVEASIKFNVKMYYTDKDSLATMKANLTKLKKLVFPYEELSVITYGKDTNKQTQAVSFSPNLVYFSISGLYHNLFAYVEELSFSIDDNVSWATVDEDMSGNKTEPYPTAIDVSLGFKIIPNVKISTGETKTLSYNFSSGSMDMLIVGDAVKPT